MSIIYDNVYLDRNVIQNSSHTVNSLNAAQSNLKSVERQFSNAQSSLSGSCSTVYSLQNKLSSVQDSLSYKQSEYSSTRAQMNGVERSIQDEKLLVEEAKRKFGEGLKEKCYQKQYPTRVERADVIGRDSIFGHFEDLLYKRNIIYEIILFHGVSGIGKTYLANALGCMCGFNFKQMSENDVLDLADNQIIEFVGYVFEAARAQLPCFVLIDNLDIILNKFRSSMMRSLFVSILLQQLNGMGANHQQMVIMTATDVSVIGKQPALLSRCDKIFYLDGAAGDEKLAYVRRQMETGRNGKFSLGWSPNTNAKAVAQTITWCPTYGLLDYYMWKTKRLAGFGQADLSMFRSAVGSTSRVTLNIEPYDKFVSENDNYVSIDDFLKQ